jgi:hypothetical protein
VHRALDASVRLIDSTLRMVARSERCAHRRPIRTSLSLHEASLLLSHASRKLVRATRELALTNERIILEPEPVERGPELLVQTIERWLEITEWLQETAGDVFSRYEDVLLGIADGSLIPEQPAPRRPRIILAPRPHAIRDFVLRRQPRVVDRIASILRRRRRTPRPAAVRVPRRSLLGRAPPLATSPR